MVSAKFARALPAPPALAAKPPNPLALEMESWTIYPPQLETVAHHGCLPTIWRACAIVCVCVIVLGHCARMCARENTPERVSARADKQCVSVCAFGCVCVRPWKWVDSHIRTRSYAHGRIDTHFSTHVHTHRAANFRAGDTRRLGQTDQIAAECSPLQNRTPIPMQMQHEVCLLPRAPHHQAQPRPPFQHRARWRVCVQRSCTATPQDVEREGWRGAWERHRPCLATPAGQATNL
jgi:hypothetical protein